jgi:hypothetical protein
MAAGGAIILIASLHHPTPAWLTQCMAAGHGLLA